MTIYCTCGAANQYSGTRPKFCGHCSEPFDKTAANLAKAARTPESIREAKQPDRRRRDYEYEEEEADVKEVFTMDGVGIAGEPNPHKFTVAALRDNAAIGGRQSSAGDASIPEIAGQLNQVKNEALKNMLGQNQ